ncbi:proline dehydrogenase [Streptomyces sp. NPDC006682]|uniref:proline dehydrogenase n=1 Tax=Streptomyces TaxID=1883 RepID=UPI001370B462|nr:MULTISPECIES: proline dehydrogenase [unclassified Streptomyces]MYT57268.1 proline dehydrogenase [Streptomyces sp. SID7834]WJY29517.1 proline dehydrogenase [Streptomyces sp. P9-2B-1]
MDSGFAAVLGAAVGSLATLGAAFITGRSQAKAQQKQWHRQQRRDACAVYLGALHARDIAMDGILDLLRRDAPVADIDDAVRRFVSLAREVHRAVEVVMLEGPAALAASAERVARASGDLSQVMRGMVNDAHAGDTTHRTENLARAARMEHALYQAVQDFRRKARDTITNTG